MSRVFFVVVDPDAGVILRTGNCVEEDAALQGERVFVSPTDPQITARTHRFDATSSTFITLSPETDQ